MEQPAERPRLRFSIRGVLLATALVAVAAAPVGWLGPIYGISAAVSLALLGGVAWALPRRRAVSIAVYCVAAVFASALLFSSALFLQAVATLVIGWLGVATPRWNRQVFVACVVAMFLAYVPAFRQALASDRQIQTMRANWPLVSVAPRLPEDGTRVLLSSSPLSPERKKQLDRLDRNARGNSQMAYALSKVHSDRYRRFANARGFGVSRMRVITPSSLVRQSSGADQLELPVSLPAGSDGKPSPHVHRETLETFLDADRVGYVESLERVAGFVGHGFDRLPFADKWNEAAVEPDDKREWRLDRLDLIGLALRGEPVAYVSDKLPNMEELREAPTRPLDDFEAEALEVFDGQEDLVIDEKITDDETHVRMVGAIRAGESCAACHEVPFGTLLGAFSYDLTRLNPARSRPSAGG